MTKKIKGPQINEFEGLFSKTVLKNGIRVVSETHTHTRAVAIGFWVTAGTRDESPDQAGLSHMLEHLTFKGTKTRTAFQLAKALEEVGGELNAYTTREYTCYHALVLKDHWKRAIEVLSDLIANMDLKEPHFNLEKAVVLQELSSSFENHEDHIYDEFLERVYKGNPLGKPILGNEESLLALRRKDVNAYYKSRYVGRQILISCAGNVDHGELIQEIQKHLSRVPAGKVLPERKSPRFVSFSQVLEKNTDQVHMLLGIPTGSYKGPWRFEAFIINALLGGGMTSKLFQSVRERKGLTYSVYSSLNTFTDVGLLMVYASMEPDKIKDVGKTILRSMFEIRDKGVSKNHLNLFKTQVIGSILLGSEDVENRMTSLAINEMVLGRYKPVQEIIHEIESVSQSSLVSYLEKYFKLDRMGGLLLGAGVEKHKSWWQDFFTSQ